MTVTAMANSATRGDQMAARDTGSSMMRRRMRLGGFGAGPAGASGIGAGLFSRLDRITQAPACGSASRAAGRAVPVIGQGRHRSP
jgi:hypothetical protein